MICYHVVFEINSCYYYYYFFSRETLVISDILTALEMDLVVLTALGEEENWMMFDTLVLMQVSKSSFEEVYQENVSSNGSVLLFPCPFY